MPHYHFQMIKSSKGRKNKLEGRMWPACLTLAMPGIEQGSKKHHILPGMTLFFPLDSMKSVRKHPKPKNYFYEITIFPH